MTVEPWRAETPVARGWRIVEADAAVAIAEREAIGTSARVVVWPPEGLSPALRTVDEVLWQLDRQASRFRFDSELSRIVQSSGGCFFISEGLAELIDVALAAARWTDGLVDPTVGAALVALGYDRDFTAIEERDDPATTAPAAGYHAIELNGRLLRLQPGLELDLGATAKGLGADRAAHAAHNAVGSVGGVLVSLGGDVALGGAAPRDGWPILVADDHRSGEGGATQLIRLANGAIATSSVTIRRWRRGGHELHHIVDPMTGRPAEGPWRSASVAAHCCAEANAASTAALVAGTRASSWLEQTGLPARLIARNGRVETFGDWPERDGGSVVLTPGLSGPVTARLGRRTR